MQSPTMKREQAEPVQVAIGIVARNEETGIVATLGSLFEQSIFEELNRRGWKCEILCLANGCTDRTAEVAAHHIRCANARASPSRRLSRTRIQLAERGKINAWNQFVHAFSAKEARFLFLMDSDILIHRRKPSGTWCARWNVTCRPTSPWIVPANMLFSRLAKSLWDRLSLAASRLTSSAEGQLCGQLYCIRAKIARNIYLPKDLAACEDGFIKTLVCTDFLTIPSSLSASAWRQERNIPSRLTPRRQPFLRIKNGRSWARPLCISWWTAI
jgi:glycosyltransferase involved in cell wall biosynthesis